MSRTNFWPRTSAALALLSVTMLLTAAHGQTESVLHDFAADGTDGYQPYAGVAVDAAGNVYGTTYVGGMFGLGTVYKITKSGTETILHNFAGDGTDGYYPYGGSVVLDKAGNLYGTTSQGGANGAGTVFKIDPSGTETILHSFAGDGIDGYAPFAGVALDKKGNLYGTTYVGGAFNAGTVYKITPTGSESVLYSFMGGADGCNPYATGVVVGKKSVLYGTTNGCGANSLGTVFKVTQAGVETVLHNFAADGVDGYYPYAGIALDKAGNLYGTTYYGGANNYGVAFKLSPAGTETILHTFNADGVDGGNPYSGVTLDKAGNVYGTTYYGGASGYGMVFKIDTAGTETVLHSFGGPDGANPTFSAPALGKKGVLYGTTQGGGVNGVGVVYKIAP